MIEHLNLRRAELLGEFLFADARSGSPDAAGRFFGVGCVLGKLAAVDRSCSVSGRSFRASASISASRFASARPRDGATVCAGIGNDFELVRVSRNGEPLGVKLPIVFRIQERRFERKVGGTQNHHGSRLLAEQERNLNHADREAGIKQERQDDNHEQGAPVANLVADLPMEDETDLLPIHTAAGNPSSAWEMSPKNTSSNSLSPSPRLQFGRRAGCENPAFIDNCGPVAEFFDFAHDVRRVDDALPLVAKRADRGEDGPRHQDVEPHCRLVEDQDGRIVNNRAGDRDFLLHAGRHFRAEHVTEVVHLQRRKNLGHASLEDRFLHPVKMAEVFDEFLRVIRS